MTNQHSILPPSSAARRVACPGSRALEAQYPELQDSEYAREGEAAHLVASTMLKTSKGLKFTVGDICPNGQIVTQEMIDGAELYVDTILNEYKFESKFINIEQKVDMPNIHPESWGTPDAWAFVGEDVYIWDYKFGHGFIEVFENWQLIAYAAGVLNFLKLNGFDFETFKIHMFIIQPRSYHREGPIRKWSISSRNLENDYFFILRNKEYEAMSDSAECRPNPECTYCTARHACSALQRSALNSVDLATANTPNNLTNIGIGSELRYLKRAHELLEARITGLEEQAIAKINSGARIPYFRIENAPGRERWKQSAEEVIIMGEMMGVDLAKPREVITPKQAIKKGLMSNVVQSLSEVSKGSAKLVLDNARKVFKGKL